MDDVRPTRRVESPPAVLWAMALLSLSPFPITALIYCYGPADLSRPALTSLLTWSSVVLSFLGGVRWGLESREPHPRAHRLFFAAGTYTFDPQTYRLVQLFPDVFWSETTMAVGGLTLFLSLVVALVATRRLRADRASRAAGPEGDAR